MAIGVKHHNNSDNKNLIISLAKDTVNLTFRKHANSKIKVVIYDIFYLPKIDSLWQFKEQDLCQFLESNPLLLYCLKKMS